jgi:beta-lactamase class A
MMTIEQKLDAIIAEADGVTGLYARRLSDDHAIAINADVPFALASVVKLPLLIHLLRKVDAGELNLATRVTLHAADRVPGSGVLKDMSAGLAPTLYDFMLLMMIVSDNMATDKLFSLTSPAAVEAEMHALGYTSIYIPQTIKQMLYSVTTLSEDADYETIEALFAQPEREEPTHPVGSSHEQGDRATPHDIAKLLVDLYEGRLLTTTRDLALDILEKCRSDERIPADLPKGTKVAHKTGTLNGVTNDAGLVLQGENTYVVVLFQRGDRDKKRATRVLAAASACLYDHFTTT